MHDLRGKAFDAMQNCCARNAWQWRDKAYDWSAINEAIEHGAIAAKEILRAQIRKSRFALCMALRV
jgi:hypothetical protein